MTNTNRITFMQFWKTANDILRSHRLPEMLYGEARSYWLDAQWVAC